MTDARRLIQIADELAPVMRSRRFAEAVAPLVLAEQKRERRRFARRPDS